MDGVPQDQSFNFHKNAFAKEVKYMKIGYNKRSGILKRMFILKVYSTMSIFENINQMDI